MDAIRKSFITHASKQKVTSRDITGQTVDNTRMQRRHHITEPEQFKLKDAELRKLMLPIKIPKKS